MGQKSGDFCTLGENPVGNLSALFKQKTKMVHDLLVVWDAAVSQSNCDEVRSRHVKNGRFGVFGFVKSERRKRRERCAPKK